MQESLSNAVVVITGASSGIGRETARRFALEGASVVLAARRADVLEQLAYDLGPRALAVPTDVRDESSVQRLADKAVEAFGRLDVWVNNAGVMAMGKFLEIPPDIFRQVMETNFFGYVFGARAALTQFKRQGSGVLINNASVEAKLGAPYATAYSASKHAVRGFTQALHDELALEKAQGIRVCLVVPANPVHGPELVASTILNLARRPKREVLVGSTARKAYSRLDRQSKARQMVLIAAPLLAVFGLSWYLLRSRAI